MLLLNTSCKNLEDMYKCMPKSMRKMIAEK